ncbi:MAG: LCP family protein [Thermoflexales bacterium]|nr:LCP family protein [Thermoflexales bacterium]
MTALAVLCSTAARAQERTPSAPFDPTELPQTPTPSVLQLLPTAPPVRLPAVSPTPTVTVEVTASETISAHVVLPAVRQVRTPPGAVIVALLGVDTRPQTGGANTDVIFLAAVYPDLPAVSLVSIPRDTLVYIPQRGLAKVNTAFARGWNTFRQTMRHNFGVNVDYYVAVNFFGFVRAVNAVGGVEVVATCPLYQVFPADPYYMPPNANQPYTVTAPYTNTFTGEVWEVGQAVPTLTISLSQPGVYRLDGLQALAFVRARQGVPGGDLDRTRRAQQLLRALYRKVTADPVALLTRLPNLIVQLGANVKTNLSAEQMLALAQPASKLDEAAIRSAYLDEVGLTSRNLPQIGAVLEVANREAVPRFMERAFSVSANQQALLIPVEVWNGTRRAEFGVVAAARLRELGFHVTSVQEAGQVYSRTVIYDFTASSKGGVLPQLQRALGVRQENIVREPRPNGPRYRIIAGEDFEPCYWRAKQRESAQKPTPTPTPQP